jgi:hypothetical protein
VIKVSIRNDNIRSIQNPETFVPFGKATIFVDADIGTQCEELGVMQGCQIDFLGTAYQNGKNIPNNHKIGIPNDRKIDQHLPLQDPPILV